MTIKQNRRIRFVVNILSNMAMFGLNVVIGLWLTPYLIKHLGVAAFGLVLLATSTTSYISIISSALNSAVGRFLTIDLQQGLYDVANRTFNTAFWGSVVLGLILLPIVLSVSVASPRLFDVPIGQEQGVRWLFAAVMVAYLIGVVRSVFMVSAFASNRFDLQNIVTASNLVIYLIVIVLLFSLAVPRLWHVGVGALLGTLGSLAISVVIWRRLTPGLSVNYQAFDRSRLRSLFGTGGWMTINQVGSLLFLSIDLIVVNLLLGAEIGGRYGSVLQWSLLLRRLAGAMSGVLTPIVLNQYARGDLDKIQRTLQQAIKFLGIAMALPVGIVCGFSEPLLRIWLGPEFTDLAVLMSVLTAHLCINLAVLPLFALQLTLNKVQWPGLVTLGMGLANLGLAIWWADWGNYGLGVALAGGVVLTLKNALFIPTYGAHILHLRWNIFLSSMVPGVLGAIGVGLAGYTIAHIYALNTWSAFGSVLLVIVIIYINLAYLGLNHNDRKLLASFAPWSKA